MGNIYSLDTNPVMSKTESPYCNVTTAIDLVTMQITVKILPPVQTVRVIIKPKTVNLPLTNAAIVNEPKRQTTKTTLLVI